MIDEFHVLRQQLPDAIERFIRIASLGRSLGMHLIACTQHPLGQVHAEMKSNMALNLCLRVRDGMQSSELIGSSAAAGIPPTMPGAFYSNDGVTVTPIRSCAPADARSITAAIGMACRFHGARPADPLFTAPLPARVTCGDDAYVARDSVPFALGDDGARFHDVVLQPQEGGIAIIGGRGPGQDHRITYAGGELGRARRCGADGDVSLRRILRRCHGYPHGSSAAVRNRAGFRPHGIGHG